MPIRTALIREVYDQPSSAYLGREKTLKLLRPRFQLKGYVEHVSRYVDNYHVYRYSHVLRNKTPRLLYPLLVVERPQQYITMDFKSFLKDKLGYDTIVVFVYRLSKRPISVPYYSTTTTRNLADIFINRIQRHYGPPDSIVLDRGPQFISDFWNEFIATLGIQLALSIVEHPQTDGQTEIVNQYIDQRLRPFINYY